MVALTAGRDREAIRYLERARLRDPAMVIVYPTLLEAHRRRGDAGAVREVMAAYAPAQTRAQARARRSRASAPRERRGPEAARELETALALDAGDARAQSDLAYAYTHGTLR